MPALVGSRRAAIVSPPTWLPLGQARLLERADQLDANLVIMGTQSNGCTGMGLDPFRDRKLNPMIGNVMRAPTDTSLTNKIVYACEPLENETQGIQAGPSIGYAKSMAEHLIAHRLSLLDGRPVIFLRWAFGGTGFSHSGTANSWNKGVNLSLYDSLLAKTQQVLKAYPRLHLRLLDTDIIEEDAPLIAWADCRPLFLDFIDNWRADLGIPDLPVTFSTASPDVPTFLQRSNDVLTLPDYAPFIAVANDYAGGQSGMGRDVVTGDIGKSDEAGTGFANDPTHYAATTQCDYRGPRHGDAWDRSETHNNPGGSPTAATVPGAITDLTVIANKDGYVTLSMTPPGAPGGPSNGGAVIREYITEISLDNEATWHPAPVRWCGKGRDLTGLTNGLTYKICVWAKNRIGVATTRSNIVTANPVAVDLNAGLVHRIKPTGGTPPTTITDVQGGAVVAKNATYGMDSALPYFALNPSTGYAKWPGTFPVAFLAQIWCRPTAVAAVKGLLSLFGSTVQVATILQHAGVSGVNSNMRGGPGAAASTMSKAILTASLVGQLCCFHVLVEDDGLGAGTFRWSLYFQGVLQVNVTGQTAIATADLWATGMTANGQQNSLSNWIYDISIWNNAVFQLDADKLAMLYAAGPAR